MAGNEKKNLSPRKQKMRGARASLTTSLLTSLVLPAASFAPPHRLVAPSVLRAFFSGAAVGANWKDLSPGSVAHTAKGTPPSVRAARISQKPPLLRLSMVAPGPICAACFECSVPLAHSVCIASSSPWLCRVLGDRAAWPSFPLPCDVSFAGAGQDLGEMFDLYESPQPSIAEFRGEAVPRGSSGRSAPM